MDLEHRQTFLMAAAETLRAARAVAGHLEHPARGLTPQGGGPDVPDLRETLRGPGALGEATMASLEALLARCETAIAEGTTHRTEWMPKACIGDDVTEWEEWTRPVASAAVAEFRPFVADLREFLEARVKLGDLVNASAAIEALRGGCGR